MPNILDKIKEKLATEEPEVEEETEEKEPNPLEESILSYAGQEVNELAQKLTKDREVDILNSSRGIYRALEEGKIRLIDPNPPTNLIEYLRPAYSIWLWTIITFTIILIYSIYLMPQIYPLLYLRYTMGAVYILYIPGYTLIEALYPKKTELERLERFALSIGLSLALVPLVGLILNYTPWGIRLDPIFATLILLTTALGSIGVYRKYSYWKLSQKINHS